MKREAVAHLKALLGLSERRACRIVRADRKMVRYEARAVRRTRCCAIGCGSWPTKADASVIAGSSSSCAARESLQASIGPTARIEEDQETVRGTVFPTTLTVRKRKARRKAIGTRAPILVEARPNARWSLE